MNYFLFSLIVYFILVAYKSKKSIHMLQQNYYNESGRYVLWVFHNLKKVFINFDILVFLSCFVFLFKLNTAVLYASIVGALTFVIYYGYNRKEQTKKPLVVTSRVKRLIFTMLLIYAAIVFGICYTFDEDKLWFYYLLISLSIYSNWIIVTVANFLNKPAEKYVYHYYKSKAMKKMKSMNIPVVGITGSYGKTSSKNILWDILNTRMTPFKTPSNFNTPYGLIRSINNYLDKFNDIFIAEMGAFKKGEIRTTCKLMKPKYGILTIIGQAHLESFGSQENIQKGKFELIESLPSDGVGILNADDPLQVSYKLKNNCKIIWIGIDNDADIKATNIKLSGKGTSFDIKFKDGHTVSFETKLLGKHNIYNILAGIALGSYLGLTDDELKRGVASIAVIEHRLELKKMGDINIIDDAYNSNPVGSKMALDVLNLMPGTKIVVTPGMIELGEKQYELNCKFGEYIASVADYVILVGKEQTKPILDGLKNKKYSEDKIHILNNVVDAFPLMNKLKNGETYVLLENDLPDLFNER